MLRAVDQSSRHQCVLFVDDSKLMRYAGSKFLHGHCELVLAENGREAWRALTLDDRIDLVMTDLMMPVMDGHELIHRIRRSNDERIRQLPVVVVTGDDESGSREAAISAGANDFITKPFSPEDLHHALITDHLADSEDSGQSGDEWPTLRPVRTAVGSDALSEETRYYCHQLTQAISFHQRQNLELSLLHVQFKGYWQLENRFGRRWPRAVMRNLGRILAQELRTEDIICNTTEGVFSVILMATGRPAARVLLRRLRQRLSTTQMRFSGIEIPVEVRFAIQFPDLFGEESAETLLEQALQLVGWQNAAS